MRQFLLIKIDKRESSAVDVQRVLTNHGSMILIRLGLHEQGNSPEGIIFLEVEPKSSVTNLVNNLETINGVNVKIIDM